MPVVRYRTEAGKLVERLVVGAMEDRYSADRRPLYAEVEVALRKLDEGTGRHGFTDVLVEMRRNCYESKNGRLCRRSNTRRINSQHVFSNLHWLLTNHLLAMTPEQAVELLQSQDASGVSVREHAKGMFLWAPQRSSDSQFFIKNVIKRCTGESLQPTLLASIKEVWCWRGSKGRYPMMAALLCMCPNDRVEAFFVKLMAYAEASSCIEDFRTAFVGGLISSLHSTGDWEVTSKRGDSLLALARLLSLERRHVDATRSVQCGILHCPMPAQLLRYFLEIVSPDIVYQTAGDKRSPAEYWLSRYSQESSWLEAYDLLLDFCHGKLKPPPLIYARSMVGAFQVLLEHGADPHGKDKKGLSLLSKFVLLNGRAVELLVEQGLDPNEVCPDGTPILVHGMSIVQSVRQFSSDALNALITCGCDVSAKDAKGRTALFFAPPEAVQTLVEAGADPTACTASGSTPLIYFLCRNRCMPPPCLLVKESLTRLCTHRFSDGKLCTTALGFAVKAGAHTEVLEALVAAGANPNGDPRYHNSNASRPPHYVPPLLVDEHSIATLFRLGARLPPEFQATYGVSPERAELLVTTAAEFVGGLTKKA